MEIGAGEAPPAEPKESLGIIRLKLPDRAMLDAMLARGHDLCECLTRTAGGFEVHAALTADELAALQAAGARALEVLETPANWRERVAERQAAIDRRRQADEDPTQPPDLITHYMDPTELYAQAELLAQQFPDLAEIVAMPEETGGYRRPAQAVLGSAPDSAVVVTSRGWGSVGGNSLSVTLARPDAPGQALTVAVDADRITVTLGADQAGKPTTTAAQVVEALNRAAGDKILATTYRENAGTGIMAPAAAVALSDHLSGPESLPRAPFRMRALRIGSRRDGSRPGVLAYAQEHAREWVTPLIVIETARRLLYGYAGDPGIRALVDGLDLFLIPSANPDGAHFSFYDYGMQRKNMICHPDEVHAGHSDPDLRNYWGTDPNRNYSVASVYDGYTGASTNCLSQVYAGPAELSEAESRNLVWLAQTYPQIKFAMNLHSYGGYIMWPPGAARDEGEAGLPSLTPEQEAIFRAGAERMAAAVRQRRGTVVPPDQIGPGVDVLYSSAGNSADWLWYEKGIYAWSIEVGAPRPDSSGRLRPAGFQPPFAEGREEAMEFADGVAALLQLVSESGTAKTSP